MRVVILDSSEAVSVFCADVVSNLLSSRRKRNEQVVLGLATGGTPLGLYRELIRRCSTGEISFQTVQTFNLDEYIGIAPTEEQSYHFYMRENLFRHIDIDPTRTHVPKTHRVDLETSAREFESMIDQAGGIDLQILGIGADGHIGFNEPGSSLGSRTRVKALAQKTRVDNARYFANLEQVPKTALTMGIGTILDSRSILLMATGDAKARAIRNTVEGPVTASVPASALQLHPQVTVVLDRAAASLLAHGEYYLESERLRTERTMGGL
ncbi:MAG: glucosamine-6-phosphate deaminase [Pirellula sp.]